MHRIVTVSFLVTIVNFQQAQAAPCLGGRVGINKQVIVNPISKKPRECNVYEYPGFSTYRDKEKKHLLYITEYPLISSLDDDNFDKNQEWINFSTSPDKPVWAKRSDVVFYEDLKQVTDCFPVKYLHYETMGGEEYWLWLNGAGLRLDIPIYDTSEEYESGKVQIYYAKNLYVFRPTPLTMSDEYLFEGIKEQLGEIDMKDYVDTAFPVGKRIEILYYIDYANKKVIPDGGVSSDTKDYILEITWRTPEELKHCKQIPVTQPDTTKPKATETKSSPSPLENLRQWFHGLLNSTPKRSAP
jgi:hypothetical protein